MARRYAAAADQAQGLTTQGKNLLRTLADNCNENGRALPVIPFGWAGVMNISARTYQRAMKELLERGLVDPLPAPGILQIVQLYLDDVHLASPAWNPPAQDEAEFDNVSVLPSSIVRAVPELPPEASEPQDDVSLPVGDGITDNTEAVAIGGELAGGEVAITVDPGGVEMAHTGGARLLQVSMAFYNHINADAVNLAAQAWSDIEDEESKLDGDGKAAIIDLLPQIIHAGELACKWREDEDPGSLAQWLEARQYLAEQYQCASDALHPSVRPVVDEAEVMKELSALIIEMGTFFKTMRLPNESLAAFDRRVRQKYKVYTDYKSKTGVAP